MHFLYFLLRVLWNILSLFLFGEFMLFLSLSCQSLHIYNSSNITVSKPMISCSNYWATHLFPITSITLQDVSGDPTESFHQPPAYLTLPPPAGFCHIPYAHIGVWLMMQLHISRTSQQSLSLLLPTVNSDILPIFFFSVLIYSHYTLTAVFLVHKLNTSIENEVHFIIVLSK